MLFSWFSSKITITHEMFGSIGSFKSCTAAWLLSTLVFDYNNKGFVTLRFANKLHCKNIFCLCFSAWGRKGYVSLENVKLSILNSLYELPNGDAMSLFGYDITAC